VPRISSVQKGRILRWRLTFKTQDGDDYRKQLLALGAILAVPQGENRHRVIRDLTKLPAGGKVEDLAGIGRIFWVDDRPESVRSLARALGLPNPPAYFVAFFPQELENKLSRRELAFKNRKE